MSWTLATIISLLLPLAGAVALFIFALMIASFVATLIEELQV